MNKKKLIWTFTILFVIIFAAFFYFSITYADEIETALGEKFQKYGGVILFLFVFLVELIPNYLSPHLGIINAYALNLNLSTTMLFLLSGSIIGSLLGFWFGQTQGRKIARKLLEKEKIEKIEESMNNKWRIGVLIAAISPVPYLPIVLGSIGLRWRNFFLFGVVPRSSGLIILTLIIYSF